LIDHQHSLCFFSNYFFCFTLKQQFKFFLYEIISKEFVDYCDLSSNLKISEGKLHLDYFGIKKIRINLDVSSFPISSTMSRAFYPPKTMSKSDRKKVAELRREIWIGGFTGNAAGSAAGLASHRILRVAQHSQLIPTFILGNIKLNRNTAWLSFMLGGAIGSFAMASAAGKNNIHKIHDVMLLGSNPVRTEYQATIEEAKKKEKLKKYEEKKKMKFRAKRRKSMNNRLYSVHQWIDESELMTRTEEQM